jgi:glycosyltransferase involved in cell wall biosynthesis
MSHPQVSILISSYNRLSLIKRTIFGIAARPPSVPFEVVIADESSDENILGLVQNFSKQIPYTFVRVDRHDFERQTGLKKFSNNPCHTHNVAFKHCRGEHIFLQGNEVIPWFGCYNRMLATRPKDNDNYIIFSHTFDLPQQHLDQLTEYGGNIDSETVKSCRSWVMQGPSYKNCVTCYLSLTSRKVWEAIGGFDERYYAGIGCEDVDFWRRASALPGYYQEYLEDAISLHQYHGGVSHFYRPKPEVISEERLAEGARINRTHYDRWDGQAKNGQSWPCGVYGVREIHSNQE